MRTALPGAGLYREPANAPERIANYVLRRSSTEPREVRIQLLLDLAALTADPQAEQALRDQAAAVQHGRAGCLARAFDEKGVPVIPGLQDGATIVFATKIDGIRSMRFEDGVAEVAGLVRTRATPPCPRT